MPRSLQTNRFCVRDPLVHPDESLPLRLLEHKFGQTGAFQRSLRIEGPHEAERQNEKSLNCRGAHGLAVLLLRTWSGWWGSRVLFWIAPGLHTMSAWRLLRPERKFPCSDMQAL